MKAYVLASGTNYEGYEVLTRACRTLMEAKAIVHAAAGRELVWVTKVSDPRWADRATTHEADVPREIGPYGWPFSDTAFILEIEVPE